MCKAILILILLNCVIFQVAKGNDSMRLNQYRQFSFLYANDVYNGTDRYLTQYIQFDYAQPFRSWKPGLLIRKEFRLQQNVYTPSDIFGDTIQKNDRPYSSLLFAAMHQHIFNQQHNTLFRAQLGLGVIGRHAFGEDMQREIHYAVDSRQALGWQYQVRDAALIQFQGAVEQGVLVSRFADYIPYAQVNVGTVFNDIGLGHHIRLHLHNHYFTPLNTSVLKSLRIYAEMKNEIRLVAYNGTLQGAVGSRNNPYVLTRSQVSPIVYLTDLSFSMAYQRLGITVSQTFLSREFETGLKHRWGHVIFTYLF